MGLMNNLLRVWTPESLSDFLHCFKTSCPCHQWCHCNVRDSESSGDASRPCLPFQQLALFSPQGQLPAWDPKECLFRVTCGHLSNQEGNDFHCPAVLVSPPSPGCESNWCLDFPRVQRHLSLGQLHYVFPKSSLTWFFFFFFFKLSQWALVSLLQALRILKSQSLTA